MLYKIEPTKPKSTFKPFQITFTIESKEEAILFHDNVACKLAQSSVFIADCYHAIHQGVTGVRNGTVPLNRE